MQMNSFVEVAQCVRNVCASRTEQDLRVHTTHCKHNDGHYCDTSFSNFGRFLSNELFDMDDKSIKMITFLFSMMILRIVTPCDMM